MFAMYHAANQWILLLAYHVAASTSIISAIAIFFAEWFPYLVIGSVIVYEFYMEESMRKTLRTLLFTGLAPILAWITVAMMKASLPSPRPFAFDLDIVPLITVSDAFGSFPSAHAAIFGALSGTMVARRSSVWKWYVVAAIVIAIARVAVGVHFPVDAVVGVCLGFSIGVLVENFLHKLIAHPATM